MKRCLILSLLSLLLLTFFWGYTSAKTLILYGGLKSKISVTQEIGFKVHRPISTLRFRFALPNEFSNKAVYQKLEAMNITFNPRPAKVEDEVDTFGNHFKIVTWSQLSSDAHVCINFKVSIKSELPTMESKAPFPLKSIHTETTYLKPTEMVQSDSHEIISLAKGLTTNASSYYEAVTTILNYVVDNVKYTYNPPRYDALYTLKTKSGNCQNFAHLSMALLRAAGIPARIVGGISLKEPFKVPLGRGNHLVQSMGQGGHAWMEIYFPDIGWLSYDPQQSKQFTSSRHIKQTHGLDSRNINDSWSASPYLPQYNEIIEAKFLDDEVKLTLRSSEGSPRSYLLSNVIFARAEVKPPETPLPPAPPEKPPQVTLPPLPEILKSPKGKIIEFGNMEFPDLVNVYQVVGDSGIKIFDKETAEYVTSRYVYAQAFEIDEPLEIDTVSLAMKKFGGDGTIYIDLVSDENGKPTLSGVRSNPVFIENIKRRPDYYWVDFIFSPDTPVKIQKGRYWIILRHSGEVIMNWFYIPGNSYGDADDTRSTLKGYKWEDILNYDFVFKVKAKRQG
jgi:hypothetical protein